MLWLAALPPFAWHCWVPALIGIWENRRSPQPALRSLRQRHCRLLRPPCQCLFRLQRLLCLHPYLCQRPYPFLFLFRQQTLFQRLYL